MGQLFFAAFDQSQRAAVVFAARLGYLRAGARVVSHQALKPFTQILAIGRVLSTRLSAIRSATAQRRPMHAGMADSILRSEGREIRVPAGALKALADPFFREPDFVNGTVEVGVMSGGVWLVCLIGADVQHQGEADLFPGKGGELWASLWQEA